MTLSTGDKIDRTATTAEGTLMYDLAFFGSATVTAYAIPRHRRKHRSYESAVAEAHRVHAKLDERTGYAGVVAAHPAIIDGPRGFSRREEARLEGLCTVCFRRKATRVNGSTKLTTCGPCRKRAKDHYHRRGHVPAQGLRTPRLSN